MCAKWLFHSTPSSSELSCPSSYLCVSIQVCAMTHSRLNSVCAMTHWCVWQDTFTCVTWRIRMKRYTHHILCTWLMHMCAWLIHTCAVTHLYVRVPWLIHMCAMAHSCVCYDSFMCDMTHPHVCHDTRTPFYSINIILRTLFYEYTILHVYTMHALQMYSMDIVRTSEWPCALHLTVYVHNTQ